MEKGLDRFSKLAIFANYGKVEEGCDYIKEELARVAPMLVARLISSILNDLACALVRPVSLKSPSKPCCRRVSVVSALFARKERRGQA